MLLRVSKIFAEKNVKEVKLTFLTFPGSTLIFIIFDFLYKLFKILCQEIRQRKCGLFCIVQRMNKRDETNGGEKEMKHEDRADEKERKKREGGVKKQREISGDEEQN